MKPKVTLLSWTQNPIQTIYVIWQASRGNEAVKHPSEISAEDPEVLDTFKKVIHTKLPVAENLSFVFLLENISISFREQMVRHRIGTKVGPRLGVDLAPDLAESTWWSQPLRIIDMSKFYDDGQFRKPETLENKTHWDGRTAKEIYDFAIFQAQNAYKDLLKAGVPSEDAREVLPLATGHRVSWGLNLAALQHIVGKRTCWITQAGLWEDIVLGMINELATKVHPVFRDLVDPPCFQEGKFVGCKFKIENERRVSGHDPLPPCSLYVDNDTTATIPPAVAKEFSRMAAKYQRIWGRNPFTGELCEERAKR